MHKIQFFIATAISLALVILLDNSWQRLPAMGRVLSPFSGIWLSPEPLHRKQQTLQLSGLKESVVVYWDKYDVPHIFAQNAHDAYMAQGYVVASDRLWQMDLQTRAAAGRISEQMGERTYAMDEFYVRIGLRKAAERSLEAIKEDPVSWMAVQAYAKGVNAYIDELTEEKYPVEYKLTGSQPERWSPIRTSYLLEMMSYRLAGRSQDLELTKLAQKLGVEKVIDLFPTFPKFFDPIVPKGKKIAGITKPRSVPSTLFVSQLKDFPLYLKPFGGNGSNNWAVTPQKSATGNAIVANDTHLSYTLPSIWYELQLHTPEFNVYGVTFGAAPGVIIGFTQKAAWAVTNAPMDAIDWYEVEFKDESLKEYNYFGEWKEALHETQSIGVRGTGNKEVTQIWTDHGVIFHTEGKKGLALRWTTHDKSNELKTFLSLNRANSYDECKAAIKTFHAPAQNFICADQKNVGIFHNGGLPKKWDGQGRFVLNGSDPEHKWERWIEREHLPHLENPTRGYVISANQHPIKDYPYYVGWFFRPSFRAARIKQILESSDKVAWKDFEKMQGDVYDQFAEMALPPLIDHVDRAQLNSIQQETIRQLSRWDYVSHAESIETSIVYHWWQHFENEVWNDQLGEIARHQEGEPPDFPVLPPSTRLIALIEDVATHGDLAQSNNREWLDNISTEKVETLSDVATKSFLLAWSELNEAYGKYGDGWQWHKVQVTTLPHIARVPGFAKKALKMGGTINTVNANRGDYGPVWRMVVEMTPNGPKAWGNYPGGQSGNPMNPKYVDFIETWRQSQLRPLYFMSGPESADGEMRFVKLTR